MSCGSSIVPRWARTEPQPFAATVTGISFSGAAGFLTVFAGTGFLAPFFAGGFTDVPGFFFLLLGSAALPGATISLLTREKLPVTSSANRLTYVRLPGLSVNV